MTVIVAALSAAAPIRAQEGPVATYAIIVSVAGGDTRQTVRALAQDLGGLISGRDAFNPTEPTVYSRYILKDTLPEIGVVFVVGINGDTNQTLRDEIAQLPDFGVRRIEFGTALTRAAMEARLIQFAGAEVAAQAYWVVRPGDSLTGFIPANFQPFQ